MERDEIYLIDTWRVIVREWKWFVTMLIAVLALTFALTHLARRQWEATAWMQIGQVGAVPQGQDPKVEPLQRVLERLQLVPFENEVVKSLGVSPDAPEARLYRKSLKLEPMPYAGPLIKLSVRAHSPEQAHQFAEATVNRLRDIHRGIEARPLALAQARLDQVQADLRSASAERDQLMQGSRDDAGSKSSSNPLLASVMLATRNEDIRDLQQTKSDLLIRLSPNFTYETSLMWPIYVPVGPTFPNLPLSWGMGLVAGILLGVFAAIARNAVRRTS